MAISNSQNNIVSNFKRKTAGVIQKLNNNQFNPFKSNDHKEGSIFKRALDRRLADNRFIERINKIYHLPIPGVNKAVHDFFIRSMHGDVEAYLISHPKCGRTWLRMQIGTVLHLHYDIPFDNKIMYLYNLTKNCDLLKTKVTHDDIYMEDEAVPYNRLLDDKSHYRNQKIMFMVRDIKDVLVSYYFQITKREKKEFEGSISDFIRDERFGAKKIITFYKNWEFNQDKVNDFLLVKYEEIHQSPKQVLKECLKFLGLSSVDNKKLDKAIEMSNFSNMKKLEAENFTPGGPLELRDKKDNDSYKVRKGIIGDYQNHLSQEDIEYVDGLLKQFEYPFGIMN